MSPTCSLVNDMSSPARTYRSFPRCVGMPGRETPARRMSLDLYAYPLDMSIRPESNTSSGGPGTDQLRGPLSRVVR